MRYRPSTTSGYAIARIANSRKQRPTRASSQCGIAVHRSVPIVLRYSRSRLTRLAGAIGCASLGAACCFLAQLGNLPQILDYPLAATLRLRSNWAREVLVLLCLNHSQSML